MEFLLRHTGDFSETDIFLLPEGGGQPTHHV
jgi:hypothetical protein